MEERVFKVRSGEMEVIVAAASFAEAAAKAIVRAPPRCALSIFTSVSDGEETAYFRTMPLMLAFNKVSATAAWKYAKQIVKDFGLEFSAEKLFLDWVRAAERWKKRQEAGELRTA